MAPEAWFFGLVVAGLVVASAYQVLGPTLPEPTELDADGVVCVRNDAGELVQADPAALARGAKMDAEAYALARVIESEAGAQPYIVQVGVAWTVKNHARKVGRTVLDVVTRATLKSGAGPVGDGFFGQQGSPTGGYRYVSSAQDGSDDAKETAAAVASGDEPDPTGGALNFDAPGAYGAQAGTDESGADKFAADRAAEGKVLVSLGGGVRFWRPA